jgi:apolipoprotein N-acyltransferase
MRTEALTALLLGALFSLPAAFPAWWPLQFAALAVLVWHVGPASPRHAAVLGLAFGCGWLLAATWWLFISLHRYGGLPAPLAALAVVLLALALSCYLAGALALFARLRSGRLFDDTLLFAVCWLAAELARGLLFTGFPWAATGYGQVDAPLAALAPWIGVYGIGVVLAALTALPMLAAVPWRVRGLLALACAGLVAAAPLAGHDFTHSGGRLGVTLIQTNVAQDEKFAPERLPEALAWLERALAGARGPLVVAPETAIPLLPEQLGVDTWQRLAQPWSTGERAALVGLPLGSYTAGYTNSVAGLSRESAAATGGFYRYDKQHLVPFGEFVPPGFRWFVDALNIPLGDFARGPAVPPSFAFAGQRLGPNICYEDLFGEELARRFADPSSAPTMLVNLSNIGWFGNTIALDQHLHISRLRSLELQRPMLRATNTGVTAVIDHRARVVAQLPPFTRGMLDAEVEGRVGITPYARWAGAYGLGPLVLACLVTVVLAAVLRRRRRKAAP